MIPAITEDWELGVLIGPHGAPDFFTEEDIEEFFASNWEVHYNSSRTGVRLIGPKPTWARSDGGEAGLHPSNIHDNAYAIGAVDFTGDMPVILGPDGPSLGGFVCPATLVKAELWKLGQLRPGNRVRFKRLSRRAGAATRRSPGIGPSGWDKPRPIDTPRRQAAARLSPDSCPSAGDERRDPQSLYRRAGDCNILVEYGPMVLDLELRLHVHALMSWLESRNLAGIVDLTPGIRSLQVHYDGRVLAARSAAGNLDDRGGRADAAIDDMQIATRIVKLPLSWDDDATRLAIAKYMQSVRADAPWCPSNIEFIRRINGLESIDEVKRIVFDASYLVLGLGDVYLGAPVATPLDPRHRLVTTKYNPARTWTPENAVGIGGAYLCVYGMEGPGGYQFVGRTCQMWNTYKVTDVFTRRPPWLLRFFDQIQFYPVAARSCSNFARISSTGARKSKSRDEMFRLRDYRRFLAANPDRASPRTRPGSKPRSKRNAPAGKRRLKSATPRIYPMLRDAAEYEELPTDCVAVSSPVSGSVWRISASQGQRVKAGDTLVLVESMKMEVAVTAPVDGKVSEVRCAEGHAVLFAQTVMILCLDDTRAVA